MAFIYSSFIGNTTEMREWLEKIGYKLVDERVDFPFMQTNPVGFKFPNGTYRTCRYYGKPPLEEAGYVNCLGNTDLFRAVTAVRNDSDFMQWFTDGYTWACCQTKKWEDYVVLSYNFYLRNCHKATLEELIEHFKK